jgi:uncharacterized protein
MARTILIAFLRGYKWLISPLFPPSCRYVPTCSEYAMEAVERFGILRGAAMASWRLLRCHPFVKGGYDPVVKDPQRGRSGLVTAGQRPALRS